MSIILHEITKNVPPLLCDIKHDFSAIDVAFVKIHSDEKMVF